MTRNGLGRRGLWRLGAIALVLAGAVLGGGTVRAVTYDLYLWPYCYDSTCGHASVQDFRTYVFNAVQEMNLVWRKSGISFRPILFSVKVDGYYNQTQGCSGDVSAAIEARRQEWRANVAAAFPLSISMLITEGPNTCCSAIPQGPIGGDPAEDAFPNVYGILCDANPKRGFESVGQIWAHEMGHHWCLAHTFSWQDSAETSPDPPDYDLDDCCGVGDTPPDPGVIEDTYDAANPAVSDVDAAGLLRDGHEWCDTTPVASAPVLVDWGSPHTTFCTVGCTRRQNGSNTFFDVGTEAFHSMSYYGGCTGPYSIGGVTYEPFSKNSISTFSVCRNGLPERANLPDVCAPRGGDADQDGICQADDNCPLRANTSQADYDQDGQGDRCDLCAKVPLPTGDLDKDGRGDLCDDDKDGDGCKNLVDQHPGQGKVVVGSHFGPGCGAGTEPTYAFEGDDSDGDGEPNCIDVDDDNDGICDEGGPHLPGQKGSIGVPPGGCQAGSDGFDPCPIVAGLSCFEEGFDVPCPFLWQTCYGPRCEQFYLEAVAVIHPEMRVRFDSFEIFNRKIYIKPLAGYAISQSALALQGDFSAVGVPPSPVNPVDGAPVAGSSTSTEGVLPGESVRLEIWSRRTGQRVAVVAEYEAVQVHIGSATRGTLLELEPVVDGTGALTLSLNALWNGAAEPRMPLPDADGDGIPDFEDNCTEASNPGQIDADADGFGNACDADLDGDLRVTSQDLDAVIACDGADLELTVPIAEPAAIGGRDRTPPSPVLLELARRCGAADLDENRIVDDADRVMAEVALDQPPGPSGFQAVDQGCGPTPCNDGLACTHDYCDPEAGQCRRVPVVCDDGDPCTMDSCSEEAGGCVSSPVSCDDGNSCTRDFCDPAGGGCRSVPEPDGLACDDGSVCTVRDECAAGSCHGVPAVTCDDGDPCTVDACEPQTGACLSQPLSCDDGNACTRDSCSQRQGGCLHALEPEGAPCSDGDFCTEGDLCVAGACVPGDPADCSDGDLCTTDLCDPATGACGNAPVVCDDGDMCTIDSCEPGTGACLRFPVTLPEAAGVRFDHNVWVMWSATPAADQWNTYRGTIPQSGLGSLPSASRYDQVCFESADLMGNGPTQSLDLASPPAGTAFYYLVSEEGLCGEGTLGRDSFALERPNAAPCLTPP